MYAVCGHRFCHVRKVKNANDILLWQAGGRQTINCPPFHVLCVRAHISMSTDHKGILTRKRLLGTVFSSLLLTDSLSRNVQVKAEFHFAAFMQSSHKNGALSSYLSARFTGIRRLSMLGYTLPNSVVSPRCSQFSYESQSFALQLLVRRKLKWIVSAKLFRTGLYWPTGWRRRIRLCYAPREM